MSRGIWGSSRVWWAFAIGVSLSACDGNDGGADAGTEIDARVPESDSGTDGGRPGTDAGLDATIGSDGGGSDAGSDGGEDPDGGTLPASGIAEVREAAPGEFDPALPIVGAIVTYVRPVLGADPAGFFVQSERLGPALFVAIDPTSLDPQPAPGDVLDFLVEGTAVVDGMLHVTEISTLARTGDSADLEALIQDLGVAADVVSATDDYESEYVRVEATISGSDGPSGSGHRAFPIDTAGLSGEPNLLLRLAPGLIDELDLEPGCQVSVGPSPLWRFSNATLNRAQFMGYQTSDVTITSCPLPMVIGATSDGETVTVTFSRDIDPSTVDASDFSITGGVTVTGIVFDAGRDVVLAVDGLAPDTEYTVSVTGVADRVGGAIDLTMNTATFATPLPAAAPGPGDLVITEIWHLGSPDWFELLNPSSDTNYDLGDCRIYDDSHFDASPTRVATIPSPTLIRTGERLLFGREDARDLGLAAEFNFGLGGSDAVAIRCGEGSEEVTIDLVDYRSGFPAVSGLDASLSLAPGAESTAANDDASNWCAAPGTVTFELGGSTRRGTPGGANPECPCEPVAALVINEVDYDQPGTDTAEYIELYNGSSAPIDLGGYRVLLVNGGETPAAVYRTVTIPAATVVPAGGFLVLTPPGEVVALPAEAARLAVLPATNAIQNGPEDGILVLDPSGDPVDSYAYQMRTRTSLEVQVSGRTYELVEGTASTVSDSNSVDRALIRIPDACSTGDHATDWRITTTLTPGASNVLTP